MPTITTANVVSIMSGHDWPQDGALLDRCTIGEFLAANADAYGDEAGRAGLISDLETQGFHYVGGGAGAAFTLVLNSEPKPMSRNAIIEASHDGPIPEGLRREMRFGSREAANEAARNSIIRFHKREAERAARVLSDMQGCDPKRPSTERTLRYHMDAWRDLVADTDGAKVAAE